MILNYAHGKSNHLKYSQSGLHDKGLSFLLTLSENTLSDPHLTQRQSNKPTLASLAFLSYLKQEKRD